MSEEKGLLSFVKKLVFGKDDEDKKKQQSDAEGGASKRKHRRTARSKKKKHGDEDEIDERSSSPSSSSSPDSSSSQEERSDVSRKNDNRTARNDRSNGRTVALPHKRNGAASSAPDEPPISNRKLPPSEPETTGSSSSASNQSDEDPLTSALLKFKGKLIQSMERPELQAHLETLGLSALGTKPELITRLSHAVLALKGEKSVLVDDMAKVKAPLASLSTGIPQERYERLRRLLMSRVQREDDQMEDSYAPRMPSTTRDMSFTETQARHTGYGSGAERPLLNYRPSMVPYSAQHQFVPGSAKRSSDAAFGGIAAPYPSPQSTMPQPKRTREMFYDESERLNRSTMSARAPGSVLKRPREFISGNAAFASPAPPSADEVAKRILSTLGKLATPMEEPSVARPATSADLLLSRNRSTIKREQPVLAVTPATTTSSRPVPSQEPTRDNEPLSKHQRMLQQEDISPVPSKIAPTTQPHSTLVQGSPVPSATARGASAVKPRFAFSPAATIGKPKDYPAPTPDELSKYSFEGSPVQQEGWICKSCGVDNEASNNVCSLCRVKKGEESKTPASALKSTSSLAKKEESKQVEAPKPTPSTAKSGENVFAKFQLKPTQWKCPTCSVPNENASTKCVSCETENPNKASLANVSTASKPVAVASEENVFAKFQLKPNQWKCPTCLVFNENSSLKCVSCETDKPDASGVAGAGVAAEASSGEGKKVKFGETRSEFVISGDKILPFAEKAPLVNAKTEKTPGKSFSFGEVGGGSTQVAPTFSFGGTSSTSTSAESKPTLSFGGSSSPSTDGPKPAFSFGGSTSAPAPSSQTTAQPATFSFGSSKSEPLSSSSGDAAKATFSFGSAAAAPSASSSLFSTAPAASAPSTAAPSLFSFGGNVSSTSGAEPRTNKKETSTDQLAAAQSDASLFAPSVTATTEKKPAPAFSFGSSQPTAASSVGTGGTGSSLFSFGAPPKPADTVTAGNAPPQSISPGLPVAPPSDNLARISSVTSQSSATSANPTPPPFTFGAMQPAAPSANTMTAATPFTFGGQSSSSAATDPNKPFQFGSAPVAALSQTPFAFGGGASSAASTAAAAPTSGAAPSFTSGASQMFAGAANAPGPSMFGGASATSTVPPPTSGAPPASFSFGAPAGSGGSMFAAPTAAATPSMFGGIGGQPSQQQQPIGGGFGSGAGSSMFGNTGTAASGFPPAATPTPPPSFSPPTGAPQFGFAGGGASAAGGFGGGNVFGAPGSTVAGAFGGAPQFGAGGFGIGGGADSATSGMFSMGSNTNSAQKKRAIRPGKRT